MNIVAWIKGAWPNPGNRAQVIAEYAALAPMRHVLADIAKRGMIFHVPPKPPADLFQAGVNEGRRQMALETIRMANTDPAVLQQLCFEPVRKEQ
jgi:hypothetical protein